MRAPVDPFSARGTAETGWSALLGHLVSVILLAGMAFLGRDLVYYLMHHVWDWTVLRDLVGDVRTGWPGLDVILRLLLSLHMTVFCVALAWALGHARQKGER